MKKTCGKTGYYLSRLREISFDIYEGGLFKYHWFKNKPMVSLPTINKPNAVVIKL